MTPPSICSTNGDEDAGLSASMFKRKPYKFATLCTTVESPDVSHKDQYGSSSVPIYQTATFKGMNGQYDYSRSGNPTRSHLGTFEDSHWMSLSCGTSCNSRGGVLFGIASELLIGTFGNE
jgi:hypothetical protein